MRTLGVNWWELAHEETPFGLADYRAFSGTVCSQNGIRQPESDFNYDALGVHGCWSDQICLQPAVIIKEPFGNYPQCQESPVHYLYSHNTFIGLK